MVTNQELKHLMIKFIDFLKHYCWDFVSNCFHSSILTVLTSNGEIFKKADSIFIKIEIPATKTDTIISEIEIAYVSNLAHAWLQRV